MRCCCGYLCYQGADCLHMIQLMPLHPKTPSSLASFKSGLVLPFWYRLTQVVLEKRPLNRCSSYLLTYALVCWAGGGAGDECVAGDVQSWRRWASWAHQCGATDRSPGQHRAALGSQAVTCWPTPIYTRIQQRRVASSSGPGQSQQLHSSSADTWSRGAEAGTVRSKGDGQGRL